MFYCIDKPYGISSFDVIREMRRMLGIKKMGHAGTLDPLATGCLLVATENSTKLLPLLDNSKKEYIFTVSLDGKSPSYDMGTERELVSLAGKIVRSNIELKDFLLSQKEQIPPHYSALHIDGKRAYERVRDGEIFDMEARKIEVSEVEILEQGDTRITIRMIISSGGYIRSFAPLIGKFYGIDGGYISVLRRTKILTEYGVISSETSNSLDNLISLPYSKIFHTIPTIDISEAMSADLQLGRTVNTCRDSQYEGSLVFLENKEKTFISLCRYTKGVYTVIRNSVG